MKKENARQKAARQDPIGPNYKGNTMPITQSIIDRLRKCIFVSEMADILRPISSTVLQAANDSLLAEYACTTSIAKAIENEKQLRAAGTDRGPYGLEKFFSEDAS